MNSEKENWCELKLIQQLYFKFRYFKKKFRKRTSKIRSKHQPFNQHGCIHS